MKKRLLVALAIPIVLLTGQTLLAHEPQAAAEKVSLQLSWKHQVKFAGYYAALTQGPSQATDLESNLLDDGLDLRCNEQLSSRPEYCNTVDHRWLLFIMGLGLLLALVAVGLLWLFNRRLIAEIQARMASLERLKLAKDAAMEIAYTDELSGMGNRRAFFERGADMMTLANSDRTLVSMIVIDIDHFKRINDEYGHLVGDEAIRVIAGVILSMSRATDIQGRIGGEEFALMLPHTDLKGGIELAERMRAAIEKTPIDATSGQISMTASFGVSSCSDFKEEINDLVQRADQALYQAKHAGRNQVASS